MRGQEEGVVVNEHVGQILKKLRKEKHITLQEAADAVGCSASYIHRLENNTRKNPSIKMATQLAVFYDVDLSEFSGTISRADTELSTELENAIVSMKKGLAMLNRLDKELTNVDEMKAHFVEVQKTLLYMKSVL